mgnify:FL=1
MVAHKVGVWLGIDFISPSVLGSWGMGVGIPRR